MTIASAIRARFETLRSLAFGSISGSYAAIGAPYSHQIRMLKIWNNTDADMLISFDGTTNHDFVPTRGGVIYDFSSNKAAVAQQLEQAIGTQVYVKQVSAPSVGSVYVTVVYASPN